MTTTLEERLAELIDEHLSAKNADIDMQNKSIEAQNKETIDKWKRQIIRSNEKPLGKPKIPKYTKEQFMIDFKTASGISLSRDKLGKYLNGKVTPPERVLHAFAKFFDVSYDYLIGHNVPRNKLTTAVEDHLALNVNAIQTLMSFNNNPIVLSVLNALLSDSRTAEYMFMNMYEQAYQTYKERQNPESHGDYDTNIIAENIANALSLSKYLENMLIPYMTAEYEQRLQGDLDYKAWVKDHFDEYQRSHAETNVSECNSGTVSSIKITPIQKEDSQ